MNTVKKNLAMAVWFLFALSIIMSSFALVGYSVHAGVCADENCAVCVLVHSVDGIAGQFKRFVPITVITAALLIMRALSETPMPSLLELSPVSRKTKQII